MKARGAARLILVVALSVAVGFGIGVFFAPPPVPTELAKGDHPVSAPVSAELFLDERSVNVALTTGHPTELTTGARGRVTHCDGPAQGILISGQAALRVDTIPIIGLYSEVPFYRDLTPGVVGEDVAALGAELARLGFAVSSDRYDGAMARAWEEIQRRAGVADPQAVLSLDRVVWLPRVETPVSVWNVVVGGQVPADGVLGQVSGQLTGLTIAPARNGDFLPGARILSVLGQSTAVEAMGDIADPVFLQSVQMSRDYAELQLSSDPSHATGMTRLAEGIEVFRVPPVAVYGIIGKSGCVQADGISIPVLIVGSTLGATLVTIERDERLTEVAIGAGITTEGCGVG
jgi:hypothetical protein